MESFSSTQQNKSALYSQDVCDLTIHQCFYYTLFNNKVQRIETGKLHLVTSFQPQKEVQFLKIGDQSIKLNKSWKVIKNIKNQGKMFVAYYLIDPKENLTCLTFKKPNAADLHLEQHFKHFGFFVEMDQIQKYWRLRDNLQKNWKSYLQNPPSIQSKSELANKQNGDINRNKSASVFTKLGQDYSNSQKEAPRKRKQSWFGKIFRKKHQKYDPVAEALDQSKNQVHKKQLSDSTDEGDSDITNYIKDIASLTSEAFKNVYFGAKTAMKKKSDCSKQEKQLDFPMVNLKKTLSQEQPSFINLMQKEQEVSPLLDN